MQKLLLHTCCGPCAGPSIERIKADNFIPVIFYSNSNIYPEEEYLKRFSEAKRLSEHFKLELIADKYDHKKWLRTVRNLENEPEGGKRCRKCFEFNLQRTAEYAEKHGIKYFSSTLTISPHKSSELIFEIGRKYNSFISYNFKKKDGFLQSIKISEKFDLYRQNYCGCEFSRRN